MLQNIIRVNTRQLGPAEPMDKFHLKMLQLSDPNFYIYIYVVVEKNFWKFLKTFIITADYW